MQAIKENIGWCRAKMLALSSPFPHQTSNASFWAKKILGKLIETNRARFNKEVQPTLSLNLNSELSYSGMGNSEFSVTEQLNCVSLLNSK